MKRGLIDQVEFEVWAGNGGRGIVHFRREKYIRKGGPDGGDGGNGGSIYFWANPHMTTLLDYAGKTRFEAEYGDAGRGRNQHGKDADDMTLPVPVGTVVYQETVDGDWEKLFDLDTADEKALVAQGGAGGRGNTAFKSSTNTTPMESEAGRHGERKRLKLEIKILADIGLVGLPNAGKSTLLSVMTAARPEIASYPFTTIQPNLGVLESPQFRVKI
jgi:GTPase